jgi:hypothetical protein
MRLPRGELERSRVVEDPATPLSTALERAVTGYVRLEPQASLILDESSVGVLTLTDGVPVLAYERASDRSGPAALDVLATPGPYRSELYAVGAARLEAVHDDAAPDLQVPPGMPAEQLGGDTELAARTRDAAPDDRLDEPASDPVEAFLADEKRVEAIRSRAREEARRRAVEWGLADQLDDEG